MSAKKIADYVEKEEETVTLAGRIPRSKKIELEKKMARDGIKKVQDWIRAAVNKYLEEE